MNKPDEAVALSCPPPNEILDNKYTSAPDCDSYRVGKLQGDMEAPKRG